MITMYLDAKCQDMSIDYYCGHWPGCSTSLFFVIFIYIYMHNILPRAILTQYKVDFSGESPQNVIQQQHSDVNFFEMSGSACLQFASYILKNSETGPYYLHICQLVMSPDMNFSNSRSSTLYIGQYYFLKLAIE